MAAIPVDIPDRVDPLQVYGDALQAVSELHGNGVQVKATELLEISILSDLQAIEPHLPAQSPRPQGRALPVIFHKADIVLLTLDAQGVQTVEIKLLWVTRIGFEDDLELNVHLHTVRVVAIATVVGSERGFYVGHIPRLGAQRPQRGGRVGGTCSHLFAVGLPHQTAVVSPVFVQCHNDLLEVESFAHRYRSPFAKFLYSDPLSIQGLCVNAVCLSRIRGHQLACASRRRRWINSTDLSRRSRIKTM